MEQEGSSKVLKITSKYLLTTPPENSPAPQATFSKQVIAKGDIAASRHYWKVKDSHTLRHITKAPHTTVQQPDSTALQASGQGLIPLSPHLSDTGQHALILPALQSSSLVSLGQLCDDDCTVILDKHKLHAFKGKHHVLEGTRNPNDGLWDIPIPNQHNLTTHAVPPIQTHPPPDQKVSVIIKRKETHTDLMKYLHACCFSPVSSTWIKAITNNNFTTWPGLTADLVRKHLPKSTATVQGHLHRECQHLQSTRPQIKQEDTPTASTTQQQEQVPTEDLQDFFPESPSPNIKTNEVVYAIVDKTRYTLGYQDLTGRFPVRSSQGNEYILVGYHYDANYIMGVPLKNRTAKEITAGWSKLHAEFSQAGTAPDIWVLDNESSKELNEAFKKENTQYQLVPPYSHRRNLAE